MPLLSEAKALGKSLKTQLPWESRRLLIGLIRTQEEPLATSSKYPLFEVSRPRKPIKIEPETSNHGYLGDLLGRPLSGAFRQPVSNMCRRLWISMQHAHAWRQNAGIQGSCVRSLMWEHHTTAPKSHQILPRTELGVQVSLNGIVVYRA